MLYTIGWGQLRFGRAAALALIIAVIKLDSDTWHTAHYSFRKKDHIMRNWKQYFWTHFFLILACLFAMLPIATTVLISFKRQEDITRKPPVLIPCDTETKSFDISACRWAVEGYQRVLAPKTRRIPFWGST
jgi:ABC-type sugar transport system permease subunit